MSIAPKIEIRQKQSLTLTPFVQQAIKILQMNRQELAASIQEQLIENPLLESEAPGAEEDAWEPAQKNHEQDAPLTDSLEAAKSETLHEGALDANYDNVYEGDLVWQQGGHRRHDFQDSTNNFENTLNEEPSLQETIEQQIPWLCKEHHQRAIAHALCGYLDDNGWLESNYTQLVEQLGCSQDDLDQVVVMLHKIEPTGLFARNLEECLRIQLQDHPAWCPSLSLLLGHLSLVAEEDWQALRKICQCDAKTVLSYIRYIQGCNPRPASAFERNVTQVISPDVKVQRHRSGEWQVELIHGSLPPLILNFEYYRELQTTARQKKEKQYVYQKWQEANWIVKAIAQRQATLLKVTGAIVKRQDDFFTKGIMALRPMVLRDIADDVEMHPSTISRITNGKYLLSPRGIFELKFFFTATLGGLDGDQHSSESVRHLVKMVISQEKSDMILSDDAIAKALQKEGVQIARRTVAKYRETLGIPGSSIRRRTTSKKNDSLSLS